MTAPLRGICIFDVAPGTGRRLSWWSTTYTQGFRRRGPEGV